MVEEARLESVYTCQKVSRVRIPFSPLKKNNFASAFPGAFLCRAATELPHKSGPGSG